MNTRRQWNIPLLAALVLGLCATTDILAQQRSGGYGGYRGAGGGGGGTSSGAQPYNPNGGVGSATISMDPDTRNITVIADEDTMKSVRQVLLQLDHPKQQVLIKVVFLEVQHNDSSDIGVEGGYAPNLTHSVTGAFVNSFGLGGLGSVATNVNAFGQPISSFAPTPPGAGMYQVLGRDFQATLRAIASAGKAQLLSRPSILARDSQPATIMIGQSVPLITGVNYDNFGNSHNSVTYTDIGIILNVTPFITSDGLVQMIVTPQTSQLDPGPGITIATGINAPIIDKRSADTVVMTPDGQTVVIGGLMHTDKADSVSKIPLLGDIPLLGNLFKRTTKTLTKNELLIFLTPHIVNAPKELAALGEKDRAQIKPPDSESEAELDRFLEKIPVKPQPVPMKRPPSKP